MPDTSYNKWPGDFLEVYYTSLTWISTQISENRPNWMVYCVPLLSELSPSPKDFRPLQQEWSFSVLSLFWGCSESHSPDSQWPHYLETWDSGMPLLHGLLTSLTVRLWLPWLLHKVLEALTCCHVLLFWFLGFFQILALGLKIKLFFSTILFGKIYLTVPKLLFF